MKDGSMMGSQGSEEQTPMSDGKTIGAVELSQILGLSKRSIQRKAWAFREVRANGGTRKEYIISQLPPEVQARIAVRSLGATADEETTPTPVAPSQPQVSPLVEGAKAEAKRIMAEEEALIAEIQKRKENNLALFTALPEKVQEKARAKDKVLVACRKYLKTVNVGRTKAINLFVRELRAERVSLPPEVYTLLSLHKFHENTVREWFAKEETQGIYGLVDHFGNRRGSGKIDSNVALKDVILSLLQDCPDIRPRHILEYLRAKHPELDVISERGIDRFLISWKKEHRATYEKWRNPDAWKSNFKPAIGRKDENIVALNQLWEIDTTKADLMLSDGRHTIIGLIDVFSRRLKFLVTKTSKAMALCTLLRRAIMDWGIPQILRTDNGQEFISEQLDRVLKDLGIEQVLCNFFASEEKPFIERHFRTLSHDLFPVMKGFIGHNVADRKDIEARKAFAERIMNPGEIIEVDMDANGLQAFLDKWSKDRYARKPHSGLGGKTPFQVANDWPQDQIRRVTNERALDMLLFPLATGGGRRIVDKGVIHAENGDFVSENGELVAHIGQQVLVRMDPDDMGKVYVYRPDEHNRLQFVCIAVDVERLGIRRAEVAAINTAAMKAFDANVNKERKAYRKALKHVNIGQAILESDVARAGKIVALNTSAGVEHMTAGLAAAAHAAIAVGQSGPMTPERIEAVNRADPVNPETEKRLGKLISMQDRRPVDPIVESRARFARWLELKGKNFQGITPEDDKWRRGYETTPEFTAHRMEYDYEQSQKENG